MRPTLFNGILARVAGTPHQAFINEVVLRTQAQAEYAAENTAISASTCAATCISPRRSAAMPISSCIAA